MLQAEEQKRLREQQEEERQKRKAAEEAEARRIAAEEQERERRLREEEERQAQEQAKQRKEQCEKEVDEIKVGRGQLGSQINHTAYILTFRKHKVVLPCCNCCEQGVLSGMYQ